MEIDARLQALKQHGLSGSIKIMIIGLGSVGNYLLDYLLSSEDERLTIIVAGRDLAKMEMDVNIARVAATIRGKNRSQVAIADGVDLENPDTIARCLKAHQPDIIVNTSRVYAGLKYGSISWKSVRAYGIWTPLSIRFIRNIMKAYEEVGCQAIVINTSYSDATIPWLKSAGVAYPDFGSGNFNHLLPRIKFAVSQKYHIPDFWNIDVILATAHFHDVVISKEGQTDGIEQLLEVNYQNKRLEIDQDEVFSHCSIPMPTDAKRNMMNASSNFELIQTILKALENCSCERVFSPGALGEMGGYPVLINGTSATPHAQIDCSVFSLEKMREKNRASLALDGVEDVREGCLIYTDHLLKKVQAAFGVDLPKAVFFDDIDQVAQYIVEAIIQPSLEGLGNKR